MKRALGDIIILHMCTINDNHTMYVSWDLEHHIQNFLSCCAIFCLFTPLMNALSFWTICRFTPLISRKINILKKWIIFFFNLDCFLPFYPLNEPENQDFEKMKKAPGDIILLHMCTINDINYNNVMHGSWDMELVVQNFLSFWPFFASPPGPPPPSPPLPSL